MYKKMNIPIFIINLKKDIQKKEHMIKELEMLNFEYEFIEAIDGTMLDDKYVKTIYSSKQAKQFFSRDLSKGELGCALSHKNIYTNMVKNDIAIALVLEDDVNIDKSFKRILERVIKDDVNYEILFLGHHSCNHHYMPTGYNVFQKKPIVDGFSVAPLLEDTCGTYGYIITNQGAKRLLDNLQVIVKPIDHYTGDRSLLKIYGVIPACVRINSFFDQKSNLEEGRNNNTTDSSAIKIKKLLLRNKYVTKVYFLRERLRFFIKSVFLIGKD